MGSVITIGFVVEGSTDTRFLGNIIQRTFEEIALKSDRNVDIYEPRLISPTDKSCFNDMVLQASIQAKKDGIIVLCLHCDADSRDINNVMINKITPACSLVDSCPDDDVCKTIVALIPIQMTEAWMLADKDLFKSELCCRESDQTLGIEKRPESYADPKAVVVEAIRTAQSSISRRRRSITISELYSPLGQKIPLDQLKTIPSYKMFYDAVEEKIMHL